MIWIRKGVYIVRIPVVAVRMLSLLSWCHRTLLHRAQRIAEHAHDFVAVYFTKSVRLLRLADGVVQLPEASMVLVWRGRTHSWEGVRPNAAEAIVAHFHRGHGVHDIQET